MMKEQKLTVRQACRARHQLDVTDAQCLEHSLTQTENELETAKQERDTARKLLKYSEHARTSLNQALDHTLSELRKTKAELNLTRKIIHDTKARFRLCSKSK
jgi:hypothetical protein